MISHEPPAAAVAPLPLWPTVAEAYHLVFRNVATLTKLSILPLALTLTATLYLPLVASPWQDVLRQLLFILIWVPFADSWLRLLLLNDSDARRLFPKLTRRHLRLTGYALLLSVIDLLHLLGWAYVPADLEPTVANQVLYWLAYALLGAIKLPFVFVYPATAAGERYNLMHAWRHSRATLLPLFGLHLAVAVGPLIALTYGLYIIFVHIQVQYAWWLLWNAGIWFVNAAFLTSIAVAFRTCTGWVPQPDQGILQRFD